MAAGLTAMGLFASARNADAFKVYAIDATNHLMSFDHTTPGTLNTTTPVIGLEAGENLGGIDFRPLTGELYGLGSTSRVYTITANGATATPVDTGAPFSPVLSGSSFGFDFNPPSDRIRVVSDTTQNFRLNPDTGQLALTDSPLNPGTPVVTASAYTNNFAGATTTTLYGIDTFSDQLFVQSPPNTGTLVVTGNLGVTTSSDATGFDIASDGTALAALHVGGESRLYTVNLATGAATDIGRIGPISLNITGLAIEPPGSLQFDHADYDAEEGVDTVTFTVTRSFGAFGTVSVDYATSDGTATEGDDYSGASGTLTFAPGETSKEFTVEISEDDADEGAETVQLTLSNPTGHAVLGERATATATIAASDVGSSTPFEDCSDGADNDDDGEVDCNDDECFDAAACKDGGGEFNDSGGCSLIR